ncbi:MAG: hypothetical protein HZA08_03555 [Nitrospirae bacterium]|nr:hypothetical protein [Nitrospirota bacterium]
MAHKKKSDVYLQAVPTAIIVFMLIVILPVITLTGCGGKTILSEDAVKTRNIHDYVFKLKKLYEEHDERLTSMFSREYFPKEFNDAILNDFSSFNSMSLTLFVDRIQFNKGNADVTIHWNGTWKDNKTDNGKTLIEGGSMVLLIQYEDSIKITGIKGNSPFGISKKANSKQ